MDEIVVDADGAHPVQAPGQADPAGDGRYQGLNLAGVVSGQQLQKARKFSIFGCFVFGAIATPSTDPFSMTALALPMAVMYVVAEFICRRHDAQKTKKLEDAGDILVSIDD